MYECAKTDFACAYLLPLVDHLSEVWSHVQRLQTAIHVARCALIAQTFEYFLLFLLLWWVRFVDFASDARMLVVGVLDGALFTWSQHCLLHALVSALCRQGCKCRIALTLVCRCSASPSITALHLRVPSLQVICWLLHLNILITNRLNHIFYPNLFYKSNYYYSADNTTLYIISSTILATLIIHHGKVHMEIRQ